MNSEDGPLRNGIDLTTGCKGSVPVLLRTFPY